MPKLGHLRNLAVVGMVAVVAGCTPEIGSGTYFCGPERFCPPDLGCDNDSFTCKSLVLVSPFECPELSETAEPDDDQASALDLGTLGCGDVVMQDAPGCSPNPTDVDLIRFEYLDNCNGSDPRIIIDARYPVAHVPLTLELIDEQGAVVETGALCTGSADFSGRDKLCIESRPAAGVYFIRLRTDAAGPNCGGDCDFNQYLINVSVPLA